MALGARPVLAEDGREYVALYGIAPIFAHPDFRLWLKADVLRSVDLRPLHPSKQTYRGPMSAPGTKADHLQSGDRRRLVTLSGHSLDYGVQKVGTENSGCPGQIYPQFP